MFSNSLLGIAMERNLFISDVLWIILFIVLREDRLWNGNWGLKRISCRRLTREIATKDKPGVISLLLILIFTLSSSSPWHLCDQCTGHIIIYLTEKWVFKLKDSNLLAINQYLCSGNLVHDLMQGQLMLHHFLSIISKSSVTDLAQWHRVHAWLHAAPCASLVADTKENKLSGKWIITYVQITMVTYSNAWNSCLVTCSSMVTSIVIYLIYIRTRKTSSVRYVSFLNAINEECIIIFKLEYGLNNSWNSQQNSNASHLIF
jgi:hypothetical protein